MKVLISDIQQGKICKVVVHNLDRLTRSVTDLMFMLELFNEYDVQLFSLKEKIDTKTAIGRFFVSMIILVAQWETEAISERTIRGMDQSAYEGNWVHGRAPFGYDLVDKRLEINPRESAIVKEAYYLYFYEFKSRGEIRHIFNNAHRMEKFMWTYDRIKHLLNNKIYKGTYENARISIDNHSPAILEASYFDDVQHALALRNKRSQYPYIFKGKCKDSRTGELLAVKPTKKSAGYYLYYKNSNGQYINESNLINDLTVQMNNHIKDIVMNSIESKVNTLKRVDSNKNLLDYLLDKGLVSIDYYSSQCKLLYDNQSKHEIEITKLSNSVWKWENMSTTQRQIFVRKNVVDIVINMHTLRVKDIEFKTNK